jgi:hypothetical protein
MLGHYASNCQNFTNVNHRNHNPNQANITSPRSEILNHTNPVGAEHGSSMVTSANISSEHNETQFIFCNHNTSQASFNTTIQKHDIPKSWILLDNQSTLDVFANPTLLKNIRVSKKSMHIDSTGGVSHTNLIGELPGYGTVWYHKGGIANILSLAWV